MSSRGDSDMRRALGVPCVLAPVTSSALSAMNYTGSAVFRGWVTGFVQQVRDSGAVLPQFPYEDQNHPLYTIYSTANIRRLLSAVANPIKEGSEFRLSDGSRPISPRKMLQIYLDALLGMIFDFMSNPDDDGSLLVTFRRTVENFMRLHCFSGVEHVDIMVAFENLDRFQRLTENKARTPEDATVYEEFCDGLPPQILSYLQFTLSVMAPDLMERSITNSLGSFLMGLMTQSLIGESGVKLEGIEEALLRMILERAVRKISSINVSD